MIIRVSIALLVALSLGACGDAGNASAGGEASGSGIEGLSADLLDSREQLAADERQQMSVQAGTVEGDVSDFLNTHLPIERVDLDTLGFTYGDPDAPVAILEFSDFGCGYCRQFHLETFPTLLERHVETGRVQWKYVPMLLGIFPNAIEAAQVGECVGEQGLFLEVSDLLFQRQSDWKQAGDDPMPVLMEIVEAAGGDTDQVEACVAENRHAARIASGTAFFANSGGRGTPTFFILGMGQPIPGAVPLELFSEILDTAYVAITRAEQDSIAAAGGQ